MGFEGQKNIKDIEKPKEYRVRMCDYEELIIEMIRKIKDERFLRRIYIIINDYIKEKSE